MATMEIERKWSINTSTLPRVHGDTNFKEEHVIEQWYLVADDESQVRVSHRHENKGSRYTLNIKNGNGLSRKEVKINITYKDFLRLIAQCDAVEPIKKHIYIFTLPSGHELEISQVDDDWWYMEVEFFSEDEAEKFDIFQYVYGSISDRTGDPDYAMKNYWRRTRLRSENG